MSVTTQTAYGVSSETTLGYEEAVDRITDELLAEGFGVLTTIDVKQTLKNKLDVDVDRYIILGACNPTLAHQAIEAEREIGLLLPCNVIVYEQDGSTRVSVMDPIAALEIAGNPELAPLGAEAKAKLERALERLP